MYVNISCSPRLKLKQVYCYFFWGGNLGEAKCLTLGRNSIFVWDATSQSTKWLDMLKTWGAMAHCPMATSMHTAGENNKLNQGFHFQIAPRVKWSLKVTKGPHCDADAVITVPELYWEQLVHLISCERYHELEANQIIYSGLYGRSKGIVHSLAGHL